MTWHVWTVCQHSTWYVRQKCTSLWPMWRCSSLTIRAPPSAVWSGVSSVEVYRCFGGMSCLHFQDRQICSNYTASHSTRAWSSNFRLNTEVDRLTTLESDVLRGISWPAKRTKNFSWEELRNLYFSQLYKAGWDEWDMYHAYYILSRVWMWL
jgi:hypothetical protein